MLRARAHASCASRPSCARVASTPRSARVGARTSRRRADSSRPPGRRHSVGGIGVVLNPRARKNRNRADEIGARIASALGQDGLVRVTQSLDAVGEAAVEFHDRGIEILAICGGDGTFHCTLTAFHAVYGADALPAL